MDLTITEVVVVAMADTTTELLEEEVEEDTEEVVEEVSTGRLTFIPSF